MSLVKKAQQKATEWSRLVHIRSGSLGATDALLPVVCFQLAAEALGVPFDKRVLIGSTGLTAASYNTHLICVRNILSKELDAIGGSFRPEEAARTFSCFELLPNILKIRTEYLNALARTLPAKEAVCSTYQESTDVFFEALIDQSHPKFFAAALYLVGRASKRSVDKDVARTTLEDFDGLLLSMRTIIPALEPTKRPRSAGDILHAAEGNGTLGKARLQILQKIDHNACQAAARASECDRGQAGTSPVTSHAPHVTRRDEPQGEGTSVGDVPPSTASEAHPSLAFLFCDNGADINSGTPVLESGSATERQIDALLPCIRPAAPKSSVTVAKVPPQVTDGPPPTNQASLPAPSAAQATAGNPAVEEASQSRHAGETGVPCWAAPTSQKQESTPPAERRKRILVQPTITRFFAGTAPQHKLARVEEN